MLSLSRRLRTLALSPTGRPLRLLFPLAPPTITPTPAGARFRLRPTVTPTPTGARFYLRPVPSTDSEQVSQANPPIEEIKSWGFNELLDWIKQRHPKLLEGDLAEKFREAAITGSVFLSLANNVEAFKKECNLPFGPSKGLADLAMELVGGETVRIKEKQQDENIKLIYNEPFSSAIQAQVLLGSRISPREKTVKRLVELIDSEWVLHIRGTPATGKTTLAYLLRRYYQNHGNMVVLLNRPIRPSSMSLDSYLTEQCKKEGYFGVQLHLDDIIFIIDEAQTAYPDGDLWQYIKSRKDQLTGPKFCVFTVYGSPSGVRSTTDPTPDVLSYTKQISILPSHKGDTHDVGLFYNQEEFEEVVARYCASPDQNLPLRRDAWAYLFSITNGHPGAVYSILHYLNETYRLALRTNVIRSVTEDHLITTLSDDNSVFTALTQHAYPVYRSFPTQKKLTIPAIEVLNNVLRDGEVLFDPNHDGMKLCSKEGWVHVTTTDNNPSSLICFLPSRLHEKYVEYFLASVDPKQFPYQKFPNLRELCMAILKGFSRKSLSLSTTERGSTIAAKRTLESQYQDEFYRTFISLVGNGIGISSEWSRNKGSSSNKSGRIDFRILGPKWGVELLRDGTKTTLDEHYRRFLPGGQYYPWISDGLISDWLVIDCRRSMPEKDTIPRPNLWYAVFGEDYSTLRILNADNQEIMSEVCLMD